METKCITELYGEFRWAQHETVADHVTVQQLVVLCLQLVCLQREPGLVVGSSIFMPMLRFASAAALCLQLLCLQRSSFGRQPAGCIQLLALHALSGFQYSLHKATAHTLL